MNKINECKEVKVDRRRFREMSNAGRHLIESLNKDQLSEEQKNLAADFIKIEGQLWKKSELQALAQDTYRIYIDYRDKYGKEHIGSRTLYHEYKKCKAELDNLKDTMRQEDLRYEALLNGKNV